MNKIAMALGYAVMILMAAGAIWGIVSAICTRIESSKEARRMLDFLNKLNQYDRWLGFEFPQMAWLASVLHHEVVHPTHSMEQIREEARKRFLKYNPEEDRKESLNIPWHDKDLPGEYCPSDDTRLIWDVPASVYRCPTCLKSYAANELKKPMVVDDPGIPFDKDEPKEG